VSVCGEMEFAIRLVVAILPVFYRGLVSLKPIVLATHNENHANGSQRRRNNKDQNPTLQCLNHSSARGSRLSITEGTILRKSRHGGEQQGQSRQYEVREPKARFRFH
jgi:hypothetical protein